MQNWNPPFFIIDSLSITLLAIPSQTDKRREIHKKSNKSVEDYLNKQQRYPKDDIIHGTPSSIGFERTTHKPSKSKRWSIFHDLKHLSSILIQFSIDFDYTSL